jgi:urea carboxylase system permease
MDRAITDDDREIARAGYLPQFHRGLGRFTAFAAGFSYLSILTGVVQNFYLGYREAGPAAFWTWPIVFLGQLTLAFCFADLAREFPFCGGVYAWSRRVGTHFVGWMTGWVYLASLVVTLAAVALAWQIVLPSLWTGFQIVNADRPNATGENAAVLGVILIAISTFLNAVGNRWLAAIMNAGVVIELLAAVLLIAFLGAYAVRGPGVSFQLQPGPDVAGSGFLFPLLAAAVMSAYVMYGFDTAGTLAEETIDPKRNAPRAILQALIAAAVLGGLLLLTALMAAPNLADPLLASDTGGLPMLIINVLGEPVGKLFLVASAVAIFICTLAVQANSARILFAMARDKAVPGWKWLSHVDPDIQSPRAAALVIGVLGVLLLLVNINFDKAMIALICVSIVWANLAYLMTTASQLVRRFRSRKFGGQTLINAIAVLWGIVLITNIGWPRERFYGSGWAMQYAAPLMTAVLLAIGVVAYYGLRFHVEREKP